MEISYFSQSVTSIPFGGHIVSKQTKTSLGSFYLKNKSWKPECVGVLTWVGGY
jgi:hypothetical protein